MNNWMANLNDGDNWTSIKIIPSTHNSGAIKPLDGCSCIPWFWAKCQNVNIMDQLNIGIRGFDFRLINYSNDIFIGHTLISNLTKQSIFDTFKSFLKENPSEFIFVFIKEDWATRKEWNFNKVQKFWNSLIKIDDYSNGYNNTIFMDPKVNIKDVIIKHLRGKLILIPDNRFNHYVNTSLKVEVGTLPMDFFNVCNTWSSGDMNSAKETILQFIEKKCKKENTDATPNDIITLNNMYNIIQLNVVVLKGCLPPYFVSYKMNKWFRGYLQNNQNKALGFVCVDYATESLIKDMVC